jgi:hypothetical protein
MWHIYMSLFIFVLFFVLTPGVLLSLPPGGSKITVALVHAAVYTVVYHYSNKLVWDYFYH